MARKTKGAARWVPHGGRWLIEAASTRELEEVTLLALLSIIKRSAADENSREPTLDERCKLMRLAYGAGGVDTVRRWLDDIERQLKRKRGHHGAKFEAVDLMLIQHAWDKFRLANPPISKHAAIVATVEEAWPSGKNLGINVGFNLAKSKGAAVKRLALRPWPP
jgi:hypothetical protein